MKKILISILIAVIIGTGGYFALKHYGSGGADAAASGATAAADASIPVPKVAPADLAAIATYSYTQTYTNPTYKFGFKYPDGFAVTENPDGSGGDIIIVQNIPKQIGVQVLITPYTDPEVDMTPELIRASIPDITIDDPQPVTIGPNRKGLAFMSHNPQFGGSAREVWFIFRGNLYQVTTYTQFDDFLKGLFATWSFSS